MIFSISAFPSLSALHAARRDGASPDKDLTKAVQATIKPKQLVHLDWASVEDGSYVLTVGVGSKVVTYAAVSAGIVFVVVVVDDDVVIVEQMEKSTFEKT